MDMQKAMAELHEMEEKAKQKARENGRVFEPSQGKEAAKKASELKLSLLFSDGKIYVC